MTYWKNKGAKRPFGCERSEPSWKDRAPRSASAAERGPTACVYNMGLDGNLSKRASTQFFQLDSLVSSVRVASLTTDNPVHKEGNNYLYQGSRMFVNKREAIVRSPHRDQGQTRSLLEPCVYIIKLPFVFWLFGFTFTRSIIFICFLQIYIFKIECRTYLRNMQTYQYSVCPKPWLDPWH